MTVMSGEIIMVKVDSTSCFNLHKRISLLQNWLRKRMEF